MMYLGSDAIGLATIVGTQPITGTFTPENEEILQINFGKSISKYILIIEMTDTSKINLASEEISSNKSWGFIVEYGFSAINTEYMHGATLALRYNGSSNNYTGTNAFNNMDNTSFTITPAYLNGTRSVAVYIGYTYNWIVIPLE